MVDAYSTSRPSIDRTNLEDGYSAESKTGTRPSVAIPKPDVSHLNATGVPDAASSSRPLSGRTADQREPTSPSIASEYIMAAPRVEGARTSAAFASDLPSHASEPKAELVSHVDKEALTSANTLTTGTTFQQLSDNPVERPHDKLDQLLLDYTTKHNQAEIALLLFADQSLNIIKQIGNPSHGRAFARNDRELEKRLYKEFKTSHAVVENMLRDKQIALTEATKLAKELQPEKQIFASYAVTLPLLRVAETANDFISEMGRPKVNIREREYLCKEFNSCFKDADKAIENNKASVDLLYREYGPQLLEYFSPTLESQASLPADVSSPLAEQTEQPDSAEQPATVESDATVTADLQRLLPEAEVATASPVNQLVSQDPVEGAVTLENDPTSATDMQSPVAEPESASTLVADEVPSHDLAEPAVSNQDRPTNNAEATPFRRFMARLSSVGEWISSSFVSLGNWASAGFNWLRGTRTSD